MRKRKKIENSIKSLENYEVKVLELQKNINLKNKDKQCKLANEILALDSGNLQYKLLASAVLRSIEAENYQKDEKWRDGSILHNEAAEMWKCLFLINKQYVGNYIHSLFNKAYCVKKSSLKNDLHNIFLRKELYSYVIYLSNKYEYNKLLSASYNNLGNAIADEARFMVNFKKELFLELANEAVNNFKKSLSINEKGMANFTLADIFCELYIFKIKNGNVNNQKINFEDVIKYFEKAISIKKDNEIVYGCLKKLYKFLCKKESKELDDLKEFISNLPSSKKKEKLLDEMNNKK